MNAEEKINDKQPCETCERVRTLPEHPEMVPNAAEDWQNGFRWGWYYAVQEMRRLESALSHHLHQETT